MNADLTGLDGTGLDCFGFLSGCFVGFEGRLLF